MSDPSFERISPEKIPGNVFDLLGKRWMLLTSGIPGDFNPMTVSWGGMGVLWNLPVCWCVVRPQRHTYGFMERHERFTLSSFPDGFREALTFCGSHSGKDTDKLRAAGLTPVVMETGGMGYIQASLVIDCRKLYFDDLDPTHFLDGAIETNYPDKDYHRLYLGELEGAWLRR